MATFDIQMPKMGESIEEATITKWFVKEGDQVEEDDVLLEIATDKVDSEIPSPVEGVVKKILYQQDDTIAVGTVIAVIDMDGEDDSGESGDKEKSPDQSGDTEAKDPSVQEDRAEESSGSESKTQPRETSTETTISSGSQRFYSPLVRKIASEEGVSQEELDAIEGSGSNGRVQKNDLLNYLDQRKEPAAAEKAEPVTSTQQQTQQAPEKKTKEPAKVPVGEKDEVIKMSRLRKLIASHMVQSKQTSAHVTNMLEVDVTNVVKWRNKVKDEFQKREGQKLTFLPIFLEATLKALRDYPMMNSSVDGDNIIIRKDINLGIAVALEDNNLIVPNIKKADELNLTGLTKRLNETAAAARNNKLGPDDISGGTFTVTNFGTFKNDIGTPIINQPEVAILAIGSIKKKPSVIETPDGDLIGVRHKMWLSITYDHRIIDGALGGAFLRKLGDYIEEFDPERSL